MDNDILCVEVIERKIIINLRNGQREDSLLHQLEYILGFYGFELLHRGKLVNMSQIVSYDPDLGLIYFDKEKTQFCIVSRSNRQKMLKHTHLFNN